MALTFNRYEGLPDNTGPAGRAGVAARRRPPGRQAAPASSPTWSGPGRGEAASDPRDGSQRGSEACVVVDGPFGRVWSPTRGLINLVVRIDLPLELALARRVLRTASGSARTCAGA